MQIIDIPVEDEIDLHLFQPKEIIYLLEEYIYQCQHKGIFTLRIIHGKGKGVLKKRVYQFLKDNENVASFHQAEVQYGGWGAVIVKLNPAK